MSDIFYNDHINGTFRYSQSDIIYMETINKNEWICFTENKIIYQNISEYIRIYQNISEYIRIYQNISNVIKLKLKKNI